MMFALVSMFVQSDIEQLLLSALTFIWWRLQVVNGLRQGEVNSPIAVRVPGSGSGSWISVQLSPDEIKCCSTHAVFQRSRHGKGWICIWLEMSTEDKVTSGIKSSSLKAGRGGERGQIISFKFIGCRWKLSDLKQLKPHFRPMKSDPSNARFRSRSSSSRACARRHPSLPQGCALLREIRASADEPDIFPFVPHCR